MNFLVYAYSTFTETAPERPIQLELSCAHSRSIRQLQRIFCLRLVNLSNMALSLCCEGKLLNLTQRVLAWNPP